MRDTTLPTSRRLVVMAVLLTLLSACASPPRSALGPVITLSPGDDPWDVVLGLQAGRWVVVGLAPGSAAQAVHGEQLRGNVVAVDRSSLEVRVGIDDATREQAVATLTLSRDEVGYLQVRASQDRRRKGGWLGLAVGAGIGMAVGARGASEPGNFAVMFMPLFGAALGLFGWLIGRGVDRKRTEGDFITIYGSTPD